MMPKKVYRKAPASKVYPGNNLNYQVLFVKSGRKAQVVEGMFNKSQDLCWDYVRRNKCNSDYAKGKLIAVPVKYVKVGDR